MARCSHRGRGHDSQMQASRSGHAPVPSCLGLLPLGEASGARRGSLAPPRRCGNDAPWKGWKSLPRASTLTSGFWDFSTLSTALGNRAKTPSARFPHSHSDDGGSRSHLCPPDRRTAFGRELDNRGWLSRGNVLRLVGGETFLLTSPFIEQLFTIGADGAVKDRLD